MSEITPAERLAARILECTETVGMELTNAIDPSAVDPSDLWTLDRLPEPERYGLVAAAQRMLDKGYVILL